MASPQTTAQITPQTTATYTGTGSVAMQQQVNARIAYYITTYGDTAVERIDGQECEVAQIVDALGGISLFTPHKLVLLRAPGSIAIFAAEPGKILAAAAQDTEVIIIEPKLDKRSTYYKYLKQHTRLTEFTQPSAQHLPSWIQQRASSQNGTLSIADARYLVERIGANQLTLSNEIDKLLLTGPNISRKNIDDLTVQAPQTTIFELIDAAFAKNPRRALAMYGEQRALGVEPQQIVAMLTWQLHILAVVKSAGKRSEGAIASESKLSPFMIGKANLITKNVTLPQLKLFITRLLQIDTWTKRSKIDLDQALQTYLLQLAQ